MGTSKKIPVHIKLNAAAKIDDADEAGKKSHMNYWHCEKNALLLRQF